jgi:hypothetical protein
VCRLRLGLVPTEGLHHCVCGAHLETNPLHFLSCNYLRSSVISRHDRLIQSLAKIGRLVGVSVQIEPRLGMGDEGLVRMVFSSLIRNPPT